MADIFKAEKNLTAQDIHDWLIQLREYSYVPVSGYAVASVIKAERAGHVFYFGGVNAENSEYNLSTHGEDGAVSAMVTALGPQARITEGWVMGAPAGLKPDSEDPYAFMHGQCCGRCRQRIAGFAPPDTIMHSVSLRGDMKDKPVSEMLPDSFSFDDFKARPAPISKTILDKDFGKNTIDNRLCRQRPQDEAELRSWLQELRGVSRASQIEQGVVLQLDNGAHVAGVKIEDAAFTGLSAVQTALAQATARFLDFKIKTAFILARSDDPAVLPAGAVRPLSLSARQVLYERADQDMKLVYYTAEGGRKQTALLEPPYASFSQSHVMLE